MYRFAAYKFKKLVMTALLCLWICLPINVEAVSFTAGEAQAEEQGGTNESVGNGQEEPEGTEMPINDEPEEDGQDGSGLNLSSNADLKLLNLYPGELSPSFSPDITEYQFLLEDKNMASVGLDVEARDKKAKVIAMSGFSNLRIGENLAVLTVKAEDGTTKSYRIKIIREQGEVKAEQVEAPEPVSEQGYIATGQENFVVHSSFPDELLPDGCLKVEYIYKGNYIEAAYFEEGELMLLYASNQDGGNGDFYVYYSGSNEFFGFVPIRSSNGLVVFPVQYPTGIPIPNYFVEASVELEGKAVAGYLVSESAFSDEQEYTDMEIEEEETSYVLPEYTDYFLFFGISSNGNKGWYLYDTIENTCQRYLDLTTDMNETVFDEENYVVYKKKSQQRMILICILLFLLLLSLVIMLNQFLKIRELKGDEDEEEDENDEEDGGTKGRIETEAENPRKRTSKQQENPGNQKKTSKAAGQAEVKTKPKAQKQSGEQEMKTKPEAQKQPKPQEAKSQPKPQKQPSQRPPLQQVEKELPPDLDDDFEFEFIDINR
ncbi:MAG: hypothetical protein NC412_04025 [Roseburia sp.]|nr:hypothetical protein [Roseburia sp.]MCM1278231.1 hypothetical protein [Robinsoniella sp.]